MKTTDEQALEEHFRIPDDAHIIERHPIKCAVLGYAFFYYFLYLVSKFTPWTDMLSMGQGAMNANVNGLGR